MCISNRKLDKKYYFDFISNAHRFDIQHRITSEEIEQVFRHEEYVKNENISFNDMISTIDLIDENSKF